KLATSAPMFPILLCRADIELDFLVLARNHIVCTSSDINPRYALSFAVPSVDAPIASQYFSHIGGMVTCTSYRAPRPPDGTTMKTRGGNRDAFSARCAAPLPVFPYDERIQRLRP